MPQPYFWGPFRNMNATGFRGQLELGFQTCEAAAAPPADEAADGYMGFCAVGLTRIETTEIYGKHL